MNIDYSKLKRNYLQNPLKKKEQPELEDIKYLFIELNLSLEECSEICNCSINKVKIFCQRNKITKTKEQRNELRKRTVLQKYGCTNISQNKNIKQKKKETTLKHYGVDNPAKSKKVYNKIKQTCLERYGVESSNSTQDKKQKIKNTIRKKYGVDNIMQVFTVKENQQRTNLKKYGYKNAILNAEISEKRKQTCLEKYGKENLYGTEHFKQKTKETLLEKYGVENARNIPEVQEKVMLNIDNVKRKILEKMPTTLKKIHDTKKKNGTLNTSKPEDIIFKLLNNKFKDVCRQYRDEKYPFACDFYIPEMDLYIEYQGSWTHGGFPYSIDIQSKEQLKMWQEKAKTSKFYENAIETWTIRDIKKRSIAIKNNLNWLEFFNIEQFLEWYNTL